MNKVWAVQANMKRNHDGSWTPKFDLTPAAQFGKVEFVFGFGQAALMGPAAQASIEERLKEYSDDDFILPVGDNVLFGMVIAHLVRNGYAPRALRWDRHANRYDVITI
jgi:hypothetical protein